MSTLGQNMGRKNRREMEEAVIRANYESKVLYAPLTFKVEDGDDEPGFMKQVKFSGFANTGKPDLGRDVVDSRAFTNSTLNEFLKFGRQLFHLHDRKLQMLV